MTEQERNILAQAARILQTHCADEEMLYEDDGDYYKGKDIAALLFEQAGYSLHDVVYDRPVSRPIEYSPVYVNPTLSAYTRAMINLHQSSPRQSPLIIGVQFR